MSVLTLVEEATARRHVLPLHLNAAEHLMLAQDLPGFPSTFVVQLELLGQVDHESWEVATVEAIERHPLLRALIQPGKRGLPCWTSAGDHLPLLDWAPEGVPMRCPEGEAIDLAHEIGLRIWIRQGPERARVLFQFHHACCDGTGAYRFIGDLLACYGARTDATGTPPVLMPVRSHMLRIRGDRLLGGTSSSTGISWPVGLAEFWRIVVRRPSPLALPTTHQPPANTDDFPGFLSMSLDRAEVQQLRCVTDQAGVMLNDLLLRDMFLAMDDWNCQQDAGRRASRLRIMMPTDLRASDDCEMPAANLTSYAFINRKARRWGTPGDLLASIRAETALIKSRRPGATFMHMITYASRKPGLLPFILSRNVCLATVVLSNAADPSRRFTAKFTREAGRIVCGNLRLESITGVPPLRVKTRATFSISQYGRRLAVSLRCDPHYFRLEDTAALLDIYLRRLRQSAAIST